MSAALHDGGGIRALAGTEALRRHQGLRHGRQHRGSAGDDGRAGRRSISRWSRCRTRCSIRRACTPGMAACVKRGVSRHHRRAVRLGHSRHGLAGRREIRLWPGLAGSSKQGAAASRRSARAHGVTLPAAALQFPLAHPAVVSIIPGAARPSEVPTERRLARPADPRRVLVRSQRPGAHRQGRAGSGRRLKVVRGMSEIAKPSGAPLLSARGIAKQFARRRSADATSISI